jgi:hypothetical protein
MCHLDHIGARLALNAQQHRLVAVGPGGQAQVLGTIDHAGDIL